MKPLVGAQLLREHPLARGLVNAWALNEGGGLRAGDSVSLARGDPGIATNVLWAGGAPRFNGSTSRFRITNSARLANTSGSTLFAVVTPFSTGVDGVIFSKGSDGAGAGWGHILGMTTGGWLSTVVTSGSQTTLANTAPVIGRLTSVCSTWNSTRALGLYVDGTLMASGTSAGTALRHANDSAIGCFFNSGYAPASVFNGLIHLLLRWNRALSYYEVRSISADPYQMFDRSPASGIWVPSEVPFISLGGNQAIPLPSQTATANVFAQASQSAMLQQIQQSATADVLTASNDSFDYLLRARRRGRR